jgi:tetratricopeptide (TPR) repeat protein
LAIRKGAAREAEKALRQVLLAAGEQGQPTIGILLAEALALQGRHAEVITQLGHLDDKALDRETIATFTLLRAESLHRGRLADDRAIGEAVHQALRDAKVLDCPSRELRALQLAAEFNSELGQAHPIKALQERAFSIEQRSGDSKARTLALFTIAYCELVRGDTLSARANFERCLAEQGREICDYDLRRALVGIAICRVCLGEFADALSLLAEITALAERCGDLDGAANAWSNSGVIYDDLGKLDSAAQCFERALHHGFLAGSHRRLAEIGINAAGSAMTLRQPEVADALIREAMNLVRLAQQWRLAVDILYVRADYELLIGNEEDACKLILEAQALRQSRLYLFADIGRLHRLDRFLAWRTGGYTAMQRIEALAPATAVCQQVGDRVEVDLFQDFVAEKEGVPTRRAPNVGAQATDLGLHGVVARLQALRMWHVPQDALQIEEGEDSCFARAVSRLTNVAVLLRSHRDGTTRAQ